MRPQPGVGLGVSRPTSLARKEGSRHAPRGLLSPGTAGGQRRPPRDLVGASAPWARGHGATPALTQPCPSRRAPFPPPRAPPRLGMPAPSALTRRRLTADCEGSSRAEPRKSHCSRLALRPPFLGASRPPRPRFRPRRALPAGHPGRLSPAEAWALAWPDCDPEYLLLRAAGVLN